MPINIQDYLLGRIPVGRKIDIPAYLMAKAASGGIQEISGTLPLAVRSRASQALKNYRIYGESVQDGTPTPDNPVEVAGLGVRTENLLNPDENKQGNGYAPNTILTFTGIQESNSFWTSEFISIKPNTKYWVFRNLFRATRNNSVVKFYASTTEYLSYDLIQGQLTPVEYNADNCTSFTTPSTANYLRISIDKNSSMNFIVESEECPISFIPYGYKLPITVTSNGTTTDYPVYIGDSQLGEEEYVDYEKQKIYKMVDGTLTPTDPPVPLPDISLPQGEVTIDTEEELKPQATIEGKIKQIT